MKIIGITGKICSGKSFFTNKLIAENPLYTLIDVDKIGYIALKDKKKEIINQFSKSIITNNEIDRKKLGNIVYKNKKKLRELERIVHPYMYKLISEKIKEYREKNYEILFIDATLLNRMKLINLCDCIIFLKTNLLIRYKRYKKRTNFGFFKFLRVLLNQKDVKILLNSSAKRCIIVYNNNDVDCTYQQIKFFCSNTCKGSR